ncbi:MAG: hypothetical protein VX498_03765 [Myxococcota bacterium]|nr:hypothetical protein [Myxococcota bacterium]
MGTSARSHLLLLALCPCLLLVGCPELRLGKVAILPGSVDRQGFTVTVDLHVEEDDEDDAEGDEPDPVRGVVSLNRPVGWTVTAARMKSPFEQSVRRMSPVPQAAVVYAESFPEEPGHWWTFATNHVVIKQGSWDFQMEFDVAFPPRKKFKKRPAGGSIAVVADPFGDFSAKITAAELSAPTRFHFELKGKNGSMLPREQAAPSGPSGD